MIIFKDKITGDEFFTDSSKYKVIDDCLYDVNCIHETRKEGEVVLAGSNPSAEEAGEDFDENSVSGLDVVLNHQLNQTGFANKNAFKTYLKDYAKRLTKHLEESGMAQEEVDKNKAKLVNAAKFLLPKYDDLVFYMGQSNDPDALVAFVLYHEDGTISMYLFTAGVEEEKV